MEEKRDAHYEQLNSVMGKYSFGRHVLPVALVTSPEEKYRARVAKQENVDSLEKSMVQFGTLNEHVEVVLFLGPSKPLPPKLGFKPPATIEEMKARGFEGYFTIVGDHTQRAMNQLHAKFSKNPQWANVEARSFVCPRSEEVYAVLKSWGILDNIKGGKRVTVSFRGQGSAAHGLRQDFHWPDDAVVEHCGQVRKGVGTAAENHRWRRCGAGARESQHLAQDRQTWSESGQFCS